MKVWTWLNGKKTGIGTAAFIAACVLTEVVVGIWHADFHWINPTIETLNWVGMIFGGTGLAHKAFKK